MIRFGELLRNIWALSGRSFFDISTRERPHVTRTQIGYRRIDAGHMRGLVDPNRIYYANVPPSVLNRVIDSCAAEEELGLAH